MVIVRFTKICGSYQPGDSAGFPADEAAMLIARGACVAEPPAELSAPDSEPSSEPEANPEPAKQAKRPGRPPKSAAL